MQFGNIRFTRLAAACKSFVDLDSMVSCASEVAASSIPSGDLKLEQDLRSITAVLC